MLITIIILFALLLTVKIFFSIKGNLFLKYLFTPLTTLAIILLPISHLYGNFSPYAVMITLALIFSLVGDIFNMFEENVEFFLPFGIIFFVFAHVTYIVNFLKGYSFATFQIFILIIVLISLIATALIFKFKSNVHRIAIGIYSLITSATMVIASGNLGNSFGTKGMLITIGTMLFWLSDLILGMHIFWKKIKFHTLFVWGLYAPGQLLIALSCFY